MKKFHFFIMLCSLLAIGVSLRALWRAGQDLKIEASRVGDIPVTVFRPSSPKKAPVIVIAHGFAGSQQMMQPMAMTLAHAGYIAVTFDYAGHGRNSQPLRGGLKDMAESTRSLLGETDAVVTFARALGSADPSLALVGHSMAADLVVQYAIEHSDISAVAALSVFGGGITATEPRDLIVIYGAWEPSMLIDAGYRIVGMAATGPARERVTYGDLAAGTGRRLVLAEGAEHIGVIYSRDGLMETRDWMNSVFGRGEQGPVDSRGRSLALLFIGLVALVSPLARLLPELSARPLGAGLGWARLAPVAIAPAVLTPLILWKAPTDILPILLGDYITAHFAIYGLLTAIGLAWTRSWMSGNASGIPSWTRVLAAASPLACFYVLALGLPLDAFVTSFMPTSSRWFIIPAVLCGTAPFFLADEWLTRGEGAARGGGVFSKFCFLASLAVAVALNPQRLFFLIIIVPVILVLFLVYGLIGRWTYARTRDPRVAALGAAVGLAWAIGVTFPIVG